MKKLFLIALATGASMFFTNKVCAQVGIGGFPKSVSIGTNVNVLSSEVVLERPDYERLAAEDAKAGDGVMYRAGITMPANIDFHKTGSWTYLENGERIWKLSVRIPDAMGVVLLYEKYHLPKGVKLYITNNNGKQILGAYTNEQNPKSEFYSNEPVIGSVANIEMNFEPGADITQVQFIIKAAVGMYRGLETELITYDQTLETPPFNPPGVLGSSASCHVNAICSQADPIANQRNSVARILIASNADYSDAGFCSGTLINNTGNTTGNCKPLFATASHCDGDNGRTNAHFQYWQFRFKYMSTNCDGTGLPNATSSPTLTEGAKFVSRSNYPSMAGDPDHPSLVQDFLILELNDDFSKIPNAHLAGWTRKPSYSQPEMDELFTEFRGLHHPGGDIMKFSSSPIINGTATFNQGTINNTHWNLPATLGGSAGGSSGSGLFDVFDRVMGVLSGGPGGTCSADGRSFGTSMSYSKFSYGWENEFDQTSFPTYAGAQSRLKEALDPANTGAMNLHPTTVAACNGNVGAVIVDKLDQNSFSIFPNPSVNGQFNLRFNLKENSTVQVVVYNALGQKVQEMTYNGVNNQNVNIDCSNQPSGVYMVSVNVGGAQLTKSISIVK